MLKPMGSLDSIVVLLQPNLHSRLIRLRSKRADLIADRSCALTTEACLYSSSEI